MFFGERMNEKVINLITQLQDLEEEEVKGAFYPFFGRKKELDSLKHWSNRVSMEGVHVGVYGPRRSGKTFLINHFISTQIEELVHSGYYCLNLVLTGNFLESDQENFDNSVFKTELELKRLFHKIEAADLFLNFKDYCSHSSFKERVGTVSQFSWNVFFSYLAEMLEIAFEKQPMIRAFLFFDEINWFDKKSIWFIGGYSQFINVVKSSHQHINSFITCSSNGWFNKHVKKDIGGLHRRLHYLHVLPFTFSEIVSFFKQQGWTSNKEWILDYFLLLGGYLKHYFEFSKTISFNQDLKSQLFLLPNLSSYLENEYSDIFFNIYTLSSRQKEICHSILDLKMANAEQVKFELEKSSTKAWRLDTYQKRLRELADADLLFSFKKTDSALLHYLPTNSLLILHKYSQGYKDWSQFEKLFYNWKGFCFELLCAKSVKVLQDKLNTKIRSINFDFKIKNPDENSDNSIVAQFDLVLEEDKDYRTHHYILMEVKSFHRNKVLSIDKKKLELKQALFTAVSSSENKKVNASSFFIVFGGGDGEQIIDLSELI